MAEKTKVMLVEVFPKVAQKIRGLLERVDFVEIIPNTITNSEIALQEIRQTKPDIVFLELDLPGMNGIQCTEIIKRENPSTQVIILSEVSSAESVRLAMRAGAVDYLNYNNLTFDEFMSVVQRTNDIVQQEKTRSKLQLPPREGQSELRKSQKRSGKVITVYSPKGGSGVSTIVANLGYLLHNTRGDNRTLLLDLDLQFGDIGLLFNQVTNRSIVDLSIRVQALDEELVESVIFSDDSTGVDLLAAPQKLDLANEIESSALASILEQLRSMYDYILVNTNSYLQESTLSSLAISDLIILVTTQQVTSMRSARSLLNYLRESGIVKEKILLVVNRYDETNTISSRKIGEMLSINVSHVIPHERKIVEKAANLGIPLALDNPKLEISKSFLKLMEMTRAKLSEREKVAA